MRIFSGGISTETNTFAPMPTGMASFRDSGYFPAGKHPDHLNGFAGPLWAARLRGKEKGWELKEGLIANAQPGGITTRSAYEALRSELLGDLKAALPVDVVLMALHGAMVAEGYEDCEGDLLMRVREIIGPMVVVGAELDPHNHLTAEMVKSADIIVCYKEYPHTDVLERALELVDLCVATAEGRIKPAPAVVDCEMISVIHTSRQPARGFVDKIQAMERVGGILSISITHGFPWGDVPDMGTKVLVYADSDLEKAKSVARSLADELIAMRDQLSPTYLGIDKSLDEALKFDGGPVVISDGSDNAGGGAASDATFFLSHMIERSISSAAIGPFWDPVAARIAGDAGEGARVMLRIGGKVSPMSGNPLDLECTVKTVKSEHMQTTLSNTPRSMGLSALVECSGIDILLCSKRSQALGTDLFTGIGCDLASKKMVVVKSSQHFYASFSKVARRVIYSVAPGSVSPNIKTLPYRRVRRPKWPLDT
jgi:microcystin degradation protein MlrC